MKKGKKIITFDITQIPEGMTIDEFMEPLKDMTTKEQKKWLDDNGYKYNAIFDFGGKKVLK